ncbi:hypothetical protein IWZ01DRAFT_537476 [Phyllosticta capitalensis]
MLVLAFTSTTPKQSSLYPDYCVYMDSANKLSRQLGQYEKPKCADWHVIGASLRQPVLTSPGAKGHLRTLARWTLDEIPNRVVLVIAEGLFMMVLQSITDPGTRRGVCTDTMYSMFFECLPLRLGMPKVHGLNHAWCLNQGFGNNEAFRKSPCDNCRQPVGRHVCWSPLDSTKAWCTRCKGHWDRHREPRSAERVARSVALDTLEEFSYCPQGCGRQMIRAKDGVPIPQDLLDQGVRTVAGYPPLQSLVCKPCFNKLYKLDTNEADRSTTKHCACGNEISKAAMFSGNITCGQCVFKCRLEKLESETDEEPCALCPLKLSRSERVYPRGRTPEGGKICGQCAANK